MLMDAQTKLADAQAVTASGASANIIDLAQNRDIGVSGHLQLFIKVDQAATAAGAGTVNFQLQTATDQAFTTPITVIQSDALPVAILKQGFGMFLPIPIGLNKRYVRLYFSVGTGPLTAGAFTAAMVMGAQANVTYPAPYQA